MPMSANICEAEAFNGNPTASSLRSTRHTFLFKQIPGLAIKLAIAGIALATPEEVRAAGSKPTTGSVANITEYYSAFAYTQKPDFPLANGDGWHFTQANSLLALPGVVQGEYPSGYSIKGAFWDYFQTHGREDSRLGLGYPLSRAWLRSGELWQLFQNGIAKQSNPQSDSPAIVFTKHPNREDFLAKRKNTNLALGEMSIPIDALLMDQPFSYQESVLPIQTVDDRRRLPDSIYEDPAAENKMTPILKRAIQIYEGIAASRNEYLELIKNIYSLRVTDDLTNGALFVNPVGAYVTPQDRCMWVPQPSREDLRDSEGTAKFYAVNFPHELGHLKLFLSGLQWYGKYAEVYCIQQQSPALTNLGDAGLLKKYSDILQGIDDPSFCWWQKVHKPSDFRSGIFFHPWANF